MNILLFHPDAQALEMISFCLESQMNLQVQKTQTFQKAIDLLLGEAPIDLVITSLQSGTDKLFKYLLSTGASLPLILVGADHQEHIKAYPDLKILGELHQSQVPDQLIQLIKKNFQQILGKGNQEEYCRINPELLLRVIPLKSDIYIRLSNVKYVKLFHTGTQFTQADLERILVKKKVGFLYIKTSESQEFVLKFKKDLAKLVEESTPGDPALLDTATEVHTLVRELADRLGFNETVQEVARQHIQLTIKAIGASPRLSKALSHSKLKGRNYISSHSVLLANIACSIATLMSWPSDTTFKKIVLAALFHDFTIQDPEIAKISTRQELEIMRPSLTDEQAQIIETHASQAAALVKEMREVPGEVDFLILQHHERPDGSGFPQGLMAFQITPLATIFIVAHDLLDHMIRQSTKFDLKTFLQSVEADYQHGTFKQIFKLLSRQVLGEDPKKKDEAA